MTDKTMAFFEWKAPPHTRKVNERLIVQLKNPKIAEVFKLNSKKKIKKTVIIKLIQFKHREKFIEYQSEIRLSTDPQYKIWNA